MQKYKRINQIELLLKNEININLRIKLNKELNKLYFDIIINAFKAKKIQLKVQNKPIKNE